MTTHMKWKDYSPSSETSQANLPNPHPGTKTFISFLCSSPTLLNTSKIGSKILFLSSLPSGGAGIAYAAIPTISSLPPAERTAVRAAFADSLRLVWRVLLAFAGAGLLSVLLQRDVALHGKMDRRWGMKEGKVGKEGAAEEGEGEE